jgi:hypothetical protein
MEAQLSEAIVKSTAAAKALLLRSEQAGVGAFLPLLNQASAVLYCAA